MRVRIARLATGCAFGLAMMTAALPAVAADMGGIKDYGGAGGVPVPAPVPIPVHDAEWYISVYGGVVLADDSEIESIGFSARDSDNLATTLFGGIAAGRYLTPSLRAELAFDFYDDFHVAYPGEVNFHTTRSAESTYTDALGNPTTDTQHYNVTRYDTVKVGRTTGMLNMYYDLPVSARFRPYVGGGIGITWRQMKHSWQLIADCDHTTNSDPAGPALPVDACVRNTEDLPSRYQDQRDDTVDRFDLALAAMAGFSYELTPDIIWDNGYQLLWESQGIEISTSECGICTTSISYGDTLQHHFRSGLRFNIN